MQQTIEGFIEEPIMNAEVFEKMLEDIMADMKNTLGKKANEYAKGTKADRMHNFKKGAMISGETPEDVLYGFMLKHWISMTDILEDIRNSKPVPSKEYVREKLGDIRNYVVLLEALLEERRIREQNLVLIKT